MIFLLIGITLISGVTNPHRKMLPLDVDHLVAKRLQMKKVTHGRALEKKHVAVNGRGQPISLEKRVTGKLLDAEETVKLLGEIYREKQKKKLASDAEGQWHSFQKGDVNVSLLSQKAGPDAENGDDGVRPPPPTPVSVAPGAVLEPVDPNAPNAPPADVPQNKTFSQKAGGAAQKIKGAEKLISDASDPDNEVQTVEPLKWNEDETKKPVTIAVICGVVGLSFIVLALLFFL